MEVLLKETEAIKEDDFKTIVSKFLKILEVIYLIFKI